MIVTVFDTETTGLDFEKDEVLEIAWARLHVPTREVLDCRSELLYTEKPNGAAAINRISEDMLRHGRPTALPTLQQFKTCCYGSDYTLAHNAEFDRRFVERYVGQMEVSWVCSLNDIEWDKAAGASRKLTHLCADYGVPISGAHRAMNDVLMLCELLLKLPDLDKRLARSKLPQWRVIAKTSFHEREKAKAAGFRWDGTKKEWYTNKRAESQTALMEELPTYGFSVSVRRES